jgi:hypothetical protein
VRAAAVVVLAALTSLGAHLLGVRRLGLPPSGVGPAARATLEAVGLAALFLAANLVLAGLAVALGRSVAGFVSLYAIDDLALAAVSLLQGFLFRWWWGRA